jgi:aldose sugar dehydrogenase
MKTLFTVLFNLFFPFILFAQIQVGSSTIDTTSLKTNLFIPWDLSWGPDNFIWFSERNGKVARLNPETGETFEILSSISDLWTDNPKPTENMSTGLFGMVIHPDFSTNPYVFLYYTHHPTTPKVKIVRYTYNAALDKLVDPFVLIDNIPGTTTFHNSGRMVITKDRKLIFSTGDRSEAAAPQNNNSLNGKILRMNLDGTVPNDNPIPNNYLYSKGIRHAQGLVFSADGNTLYTSEHGPTTDDEINIIETNRNYGWPTVAGFCDLPDEQIFCNNNNVKEPLKVWTPTIAPCGMDIYNSDVIPEWKNSLLLTTLKERDLRVLQLSTNGLAILNENIFYDYDKGMGRLRDVCVSPDGDVYVCTSNRDDNGTKFNPPVGLPKIDDDRIVRIASIVPRSLSINLLNATAAKLNWKDRWSKETGFKIFRAIGLPTNTYNLIATLPENNVEYIDATIVDGQQYFYKVQTFNGTTTSNFSNIVVLSNAVLATTLSKFEVVEKDCNTLIVNWQTAQEINNKGYYVEYSNDGLQYFVKEFIAAGNYPNQLQKYSVQLKNNADDIVYIRLKQVDAGGKIEYSKVIVIKAKCIVDKIQIVPNPAVDKIIIKGLDVSKMNSVVIYNIEGVRVVEFIMIWKNEIDISNFKAGSYILSINKNKKIKFVKL